MSLTRRPRMRLDSIEDVRTAREHPGEVALSIDQKLRCLARGHQLLRRLMGRGLEALSQCDGFIKLGYSTPGKYAVEVLGLGARHAQDLAWVERELAGRPVLQDASHRAVQAVAHATRGCREGARVTRRHVSRLTCRCPASGPATERSSSASFPATLPTTKA